MQFIPDVETALALSHPGFFDMSLQDMDIFLDLSAPTDDINMETATAPSQQSSLATAAQPKDNSLNVLVLEFPDPLSDSQTAPLDSSELSDTAIPNPNHDGQGFTPVKQAKPLKKKGSAILPAAVPDTPPDSVFEPLPIKAPLPPPVSPRSSSNLKRPTKVKHVLRIEARWAPRDFNELRSSSTKMYQRLAPILSCFNNEQTWMMEWQTDQMDSDSDIDPVKLSKFLGIRVASVSKDQCFYFSFRIHGSGSQFAQVTASKVFSIAKRGENLQLDPSSIPPSQGELTFVGDILLKDASVTHRGQYLQYLRQEVLPPDTPVFDIKLRHTNPTGSNLTILSVRCGKSKSTQMAEILSTALCGEGMHPEIFISRLGLGANQTSKQNHERIYSVHNEYVADVSHLLFASSVSIDTAVTEFFDTGKTVHRTPRQWAKSLVSPDGQSLEADLENGGCL